MSPATDLPPLYSAPSLPHPLPQYTQSPSELERVLHTASVPASPIDFAVTRTRHCVFRTDHLEIDLGEFPWALTYPAYGYNGVVEGLIRFRKKCTYVTEVRVKLEGTVTTTASEYSNVAVNSITKQELVSKSVTLLSSEAGTCFCPDKEFTFSLPFPTYVNGGTRQLPPSFTIIHPGTSVEVTYAIQVDVVRKGIWRRHEVRKIPVLYLPKSRPSVPPLLDFSRPLLDSIPEGVKAVKLTPKWPTTCEAQSLASTTLPLVHIFSPIQRCYASGDPITFGLSIQCHSSPALAKLFMANVSVQLVRKRKVWINHGRQISVREHLLATAEVYDWTSCNDGQTYITFRLQAGQPGREASWSIDGVVETQHLIGVAVQPPKDVKHLPTFRHEELVQLTTDPFDDILESELIGLSSPALGMTTLRPTHGSPTPSR